MPETTIQEQLRDAQVRVKGLAAKRDQVIRDAGIEEQKLQQVYDNLKQLGVDAPESLSKEDLEKLAEETKERLFVEMKGLMDALATGEGLLADYNKIQQE